MANAIFTYEWWIEDKKSWNNLTGSKTILNLEVWKLETPKVVIDFWAVQWVKRAWEFNKKIDQSVINADYLVVTHAHTDHSWMIPYLVKKWFSWSILMTELTKLQSIKMWENTIMLTREKIRQIKEWNDKIKEKLYKAFSIIKHVEILNNKKINKKNKEKSKEYLEKNWINKDTKSAYDEAIAIIKEYWVETQDDIDSVLRDVPELLFDEGDIELALKQIKIINTQDEVEIANFHPVIKANDEIIENLPLEVKNGRKKPVAVASFVKWAIVKKYNDLIKKIKTQIQENTQIEIKNAELREKLISALNLVNWCEENWFEIEKFERDFGSLLNEDENELLAQAQSLEQITLWQENFFVERLIRKYNSFGDNLLFTKNDFEKLERLLWDLNIKTPKDIDAHLPELPDTNYKNRDIKWIFKNAFLVWENEEIVLDDKIVFIDSLDIYSPQEILWFFSSGKRIYIKESLKYKLYEKLSNYVKVNRENIDKNNELKKELHHAFDLIEIFNWNNDLYLLKNQRQYKEAKKFVSNYKSRNIKKSIYTKDDLDDLIDIEFDDISKNKKIIHIKKLDDSRIYDVLFDENKDNVYYFEPKIRQRIKDKLSKKIDEIEKELSLKAISEQKYSEFKYFINIYEARLLFVWALDNFKNQWFNQEDLQNAKKFIEMYWVQNRSQIDIVNTLNKDYLYTLKDVDNLFSSAFMFWKDFSKEQIEIIFIESLDDDRIYDLPYIFQDKTKIIVIKKSLEEKLKEKLKKWIEDFYKIRAVRRKKRQEILEKLRLYEFFIENYKFLFDLEWWKNPSDFYSELLERRNKILELKNRARDIKLAKKLKSQLSISSQQENELSKARELLKNYSVKRLEDIDWVLQKLHNIPYNVEDIEAAKSLLKSVHIDKNQEILESIKLNFFDSWHIEWSVQSVITYVISEVDNVLSNEKWRKKLIYKNTSQRRLKYVNFWFSGDMWRIKQPNLAWTPENITHVLDYYQVETTYAWRIHPDKQKSIEKLFSSISDAKWKILIPAFSIQRTQELIVTLLQARLDSLEDIEKLKFYNKEKQSKKLELKRFFEIRKQILERNELKKQILLDEAILRNIDNDDNVSPENYWEEKRKLNNRIRKNRSKIKKLPENDLEYIEWRINLLQREIEFLDLQISYIEPRIFNIDIILDSPLSEEITNIYINHCWNKYDILNPKVQKKLFGKEIIRYIKKKSDSVLDDKEDDRNRISLEELYSDENKDKKEIIISASWMCDGWAIEYHLKQNLPNKKSKIIFIWYTPENTRWWKIKAWNEFISIDGNPYPLKLEVDDIAWFSAHMDEYEIIDFLTNQKFKKDAMIVLTHGWDERFELKRKLEIVMDYVWQKVKIVVPKPWEKLGIKI